MLLPRWPIPILLRATLFAVGIVTGVRAHTAAANPPPPPVAAPSPAVAPPSPAGAMPEDLLPELKPILRRAVERSYETIRRGLELEQAEARTYISRGAMLPNLATNGRYAVNSAATASGSSSATAHSQGLFYDVGLNQPVYHWGALKAQADIDKIWVKIAACEYADAARLLLGQVRKGYVELIGKKAALRAEAEQLRLREKGLAAQEDQLKSGRLTAGDVAGTRTGLQIARLEYDRHAAEFAYNKRVFLRLTGLDDLADEAIPNQIPIPVQTADKGEGMLRGFLQGGASETPKGQIYAAAIMQADLNYKIAKTGLYPKFSLQLSHNVSNSTQSDFVQIRQEAIVQNTYGIAVNWTIFDGQATSGRKREALSRKRLNEKQLQSYADATGDLAQNLRQLAEFSARALEFAEAGLGGALGGLALVKEDLARGRAKPDDVAAAEAGVLGAEAAVATARGDYLYRWAEFVSLVGADPLMKTLPSRYAR